MVRTISTCVAVLTIAACGGSPLAKATTVSSVAVQPGDLPNGMHRCDQSGDIDTYLNFIKTKDPSTYSTTKTQWDAAKKNGAIAAQVVFYADTAANCASMASDVSSMITATYKVVVNYVIQFKDEATAAKGYTSGGIFGIDASKLKAGGSPVTEGTKTGLGANSTVLSQKVGNQAFYIAVWQGKPYMVVLGIINLDSGVGQKVADAEYKRIQ
jgi:hypothetical protein